MFVVTRIMDKQDYSTEKFIDTKQWVPIHTLPGFECCIEYYVSRSGEIKSSKGQIERILKTQKNNNGYEIIKLQQRIGRKKELTVTVHKLVALAFLGNPPTPLGRYKGCTIIDHIDHNRLNNKADNLQYSTHSDNNRVPRPRNLSEEHKAAVRERGRICRRDYMRRKRAKEKQAKIEESNK